MPFHLELITSATHYSNIAHIRQLAFSTNLLNQQMYGSISAESLEAWFERRERRDGKNPNQRLIAVLNDDEQIVAYAKWEVPEDLCEEIPGRMDGNVGEQGAVPKVPAGADVELYTRFRAGIDGMRERYSNTKKDFCELNLYFLSPFEIVI